MSVQELSFTDAWVEVGVEGESVTLEVSTVDLFEMDPGQAVQLSRALVHAAAEALGVKA